MPDRSRTAAAAIAAAFFALAASPAIDPAEAEGVAPERPASEDPCLADIDAAVREDLVEIGLEDWIAACRAAHAETGR